MRQKWLALDWTLLVNIRKLSAPAELVSGGIQLIGGDRLNARSSS
jgi:hypothetical protein